MRRVTCEVPRDLARVDLRHGDVEYVGAMLHGAGGIMGSGSPRAWLDIPKRWRLLHAHRDMLSVYVRYSYTRGVEPERVDIRAAETELLAVYAPEYVPTILAARSRTE